jgi:hypothetical protein
MLRIVVLLTLIALLGIWYVIRPARQNLGGLRHSQRHALRAEGALMASVVQRSEGVESRRSV